MAVTARPPRRVRVIADATGLRGTALCTNGALIYDLERHAAIKQTRLRAESLHALVAALRRGRHCLVLTQWTEHLDRLVTAASGRDHSAHPQATSRDP